MKIARIKIRNYRGIKDAEILLPEHVVFVGDNNCGKSTILEAIDLVLGPERLTKHPVVNEHDFYAGEYINGTGKITIFIELTIIDLLEELERHFANHLEWWNPNTNSLIDGPPAKQTDTEGIKSALRLFFEGYYDIDEDDFVGHTFFSSPQKDDDSFERLTVKDKRKCGFLYLRTLRTGSRALSLEHGTLLDIILRLKELRPQMWEDILSQLHDVSVATDPKLGVTGILESVQNSLNSILPIDCATNPCIKVSNLTREHLRKILTVFLSSGIVDSKQNKYFGPFYSQGTGTINILVLSLLSMIADLKGNVIFAMEEPEIAIPPYTQKQIINNIVHKSSQAIFTSHSPYVLEEFAPEQVIVISKNEGILTGIPACLPPNIKRKQYREELKKRFSESLLAKRVLLAEGRTECDVYTVASRRLHDLEHNKYLSLDNLGISIVDAGGDTNISLFGAYYRGIGKITFSIFDKQEPETLNTIQENIDFPYEVQEKGIENLILKHSNTNALKRYALKLVEDGDWPPHLSNEKPERIATGEQIKSALSKYFKWAKGSYGLSDFIAQCSENEMPPFITNTLSSIKSVVLNEADDPSEL